MKRERFGITVPGLGVKSWLIGLRVQGSKFGIRGLRVWGLGVRDDF